MPKLRYFFACLKSKSFTVMPERICFYTWIRLICSYMVEQYSGLPDLTGLSDFERELFEFILEHWPTSSLEIAENFREDLSSREKKRRISTKYAYYLKKLVEKQLVISKKAGNSIIVWPLLAEKYRAIHEILKTPKIESDSLFVRAVAKRALVSKSFESKKSSYSKKVRGVELDA